MIPGDDIVRNPLVLQSMGFSGRCVEFGVMRVGITSNMRQNEVRQNRKRSIREKGRWSVLCCLYGNVAQMLGGSNLPRALEFPAGAAMPRESDKPNFVFYKCEPKCSQGACTYLAPLKWC